MGSCSPTTSASTVRRPARRRPPSTSSTNDRPPVVTDRRSTSPDDPLGRADDEHLRAVLTDVEDDRNVVGVVLSGSQARTGMATIWSDTDLYVVLAVADPARRTTSTADLDVAVCTLDQLRHVPGPGEDAWWDRYSFTHSRLLLDRSGGELARLIDAWGTLSGPESLRVLETHLDG